jgi:hypothetical protein
MDFRKSPEKARIKFVNKLAFVTQRDDFVKP